MRFFGSIKNFTKSLVGGLGRGWHGLIREPFSGAWQRNREESVASVLGYPALFACISRITKDIGKLPFTTKRIDSDGIWVDAKLPEIQALLRKPNHFQNEIQFRENWTMSNLTQGNAYILIQRNGARKAIALYVLNPFNVKPLVTPSGDVFYEVLVTDTDAIPTLDNNSTVRIPARDIIHDRPITLHHPLIGVPPVCAAHWPAVKNLKILRSSAKFFDNAAQPGGILTAPEGIESAEAEKLERFWNDNFTGENSGRIAVIGGDLKFEKLAANAADSQMVEQMRYSDEQICQAMGVWPFLIGLGGIPAGLKVDDMMNMYYTLTLQSYIESMEMLLDKGLGVQEDHGIELDLEPLLRMDEQKKADVQVKLVGSGIKSPDEARKNFDLKPVPGGGTPYLQQQNYSLAALAKRDARDDPFSAGGGGTSEQGEVRELDGEAQEREYNDLIVKKFAEATNEL